MARRRSKRQKDNGLQIIGIFIFFLCLRVFLLFFSARVVRYADVFCIFLAFIIFRLGLSGSPLLIWAWIGGLAEDLFTGTILGINALSKLLLAEAAQLLGRKFEIGNVTLQIPLAILLFAADTTIKYIIASLLTKGGIDQSLLASTLLVRVPVNTIGFLALYAILR